MEALDTYCELAKDGKNYDCEFVPNCIRCKGCSHLKEKEKDKIWVDPVFGLRVNVTKFLKLVKKEKKI